MRNGLLSIAAIALVLAGCSDPKIAAGGGLAGAGDITDDEFDGLVEPMPGADVSDYRARERRVRLFGVQGEPAFATIADTTTWQTFNLHVDETFGRGLRTLSVGAGVVLSDARSHTLSIDRGSVVPLRTITHRLDDAAIYVGRQTWRVTPASITELRGLHGTGVEVATRLDLFAVPAVELTSVDPNGVLAHLGFQAGDFLFELDGVILDAAKIDDLSERAAGTAPFSVSMFRGGAPGTRTFVPE